MCLTCIFLGKKNVTFFYHNSKIMKLIKDVLKKQIVEGKLVTPGIGEVGMIVTTPPKSPDLTRVARYTMSPAFLESCNLSLKDEGSDGYDLDGTKVVSCINAKMGKSLTITEVAMTFFEASREGATSAIFLVTEDMVVPRATQNSIDKINNSITVTVKIIVKVVDKYQMVYDIVGHNVEGLRFLTRVVDRDVKREGKDEMDPEVRLTLDSDIMCRANLKDMFDEVPDLAKIKDAIDTLEASALEERSSPNQLKFTKNGTYVNRVKYEDEGDNTLLNQRGFYILRTDGSWMDFSYLECITPATRRTKFNKACRFAVDDHQITAFRNANVEDKCAITQENLHGKETHVDHIIQFNTIVEEFLMISKLDLSSVLLTSDDKKTRPLIEERFVDHKIENEFAVYHATRATLRLVTKSANLRRKRKAPLSITGNKKQCDVHVSNHCDDVECQP